MHGGPKLHVQWILRYGQDKPPYKKCCCIHTLQNYLRKRTTSLQRFKCCMGPEYSEVPFYSVFSVSTIGELQATMECRKWLISTSACLPLDLMHALGFSMTVWQYNIWDHICICPHQIFYEGLNDLVLYSTRSRHPNQRGRLHPSSLCCSLHSTHHWQWCPVSRLSRGGYQQAYSGVSR